MQHTIEVAITKEKFGGKNATRLLQSVAEKRSRKTGQMKIKNSDNSCGYMAIALAVCYYEHRDDKTYHELDAMEK